MRPRPARRLRAVQTPQAFAFPLILAAHRRAAAAGVADLTDDIAAAEWAGAPAYVFEGDPANVKVTTMEDFRGRRGAAHGAGERDARRPGFRRPRLRAGRSCLAVRGARSPRPALGGHSDADVALHALADAIYGALAEGDIGAHFPRPTRNGGARRRRSFLPTPPARVRARGGFIVHLDATLVCEAPKIGPHREAMRARVAEIAGLDVARVAVKATTSAAPRFTGRGEGIACLATATVRLP